MQTYIINGEWPFILYAEHSFHMFTFIFIWPLLWASINDDSAFIKYEEWPDKSQKGTHHLFYMAIPHHTIERVGQSKFLASIPSKEVR